MSVESTLSVASTLAAITVTISMAWYVKKSLSTDSILQKVEEITDEIMVNKELQGKIYTIGALLGQGLRQGIGINAKGGKFKIENLIGELAGPIIQKVFGIKNEESGQPQQEGFKPWDAPQ